MLDAKWNCNKGLIVLKTLIRNNTEKLTFLTILEKEKIKLRKILEQTLLSEVREILWHLHISIYCVIYIF